MLSVNMFGNTSRMGALEVKEVKDYANGGTRESVSVRFTVAVRRDYPIYKNGERVYETDFIPCTAYGDLAKYIHRNASDTHVKDGKEKIKSRRVLVTGRLQTYEGKQEFDANFPGGKLAVNVGGKQQIIATPSFKVERNRTYFTVVVDHLEFIDAKEVLSADTVTTEVADSEVLTASLVSSLDDVIASDDDTTVDIEVSTVAGDGSVQTTVEDEDTIDPWSKLQSN